MTATNQDVPIYREYHHPSAPPIGITAKPIDARLFGVGDVVSANAFTDCFGVYHPRRYNLEVTQVTKCVFDSASHWRITAEGKDGSRVEAAQRFFS